MRRVKAANKRTPPPSGARIERLTSTGNKKRDKKRMEECLWNEFVNSQSSWRKPMHLFRLHRSIPIQTIFRAGALTLPLFCAVAVAAAIAAPQLHAQSVLAGDIAGTVTDPSGAAIPGVQIKITSQETGAESTTITSATGAYRFSLLKPGTYKLAASKTGFKGATTMVTVGVGQIATQNMQLPLGQASETIEVTAAPQLLQTDTANLSTQVNIEQIRNIPNPGSDITYIAQSRPGVVMNTGANSSSGTLGYGNFSAFGLPGTSNNFTLNGMQVNDPFLNLNNSGPSNLLLGINDVQETDVITNAYEAQYGTLGGVQLNSISRSGTDHFHGNLVYAWNGRAMNANNWFNKNTIINSTPLARPFSNFNQWAGSLGGPIVRQRFFFFANTEGISFIANSQRITLLPSTAFATTVLGPGGLSGDCAGGSLAAAGQASQCAFYQHIFALYQGTPNYALAGPVPNSTAPNDQVQLSTFAPFNLTEKLVTGRFDANLTDHDKFFAHFKWDYGVQPTFTDPINPVFNAQSSQPDYEGQMAWTHTFGSRAVNQLLATGSWYSAIFKQVNPALALATFPMQMTWLDGLASDLNGDASLWPEGRNVTQWQAADDFSYTRGTETFKAGFQFKKDYISDQDTGILTTPIIFTNQAAFSAGTSAGGEQNFTSNLNLPLQAYTLGVYFEDDWKPTPRATITAGVRVERNSNVSCPKNCLSNFGGDFFPLAATAPLNTANAPYNSQFRFNLSQAFTNYQAYIFQPRIGFTASVTPKTVFRGGFGMFSDVFPGTLADSMLMNPPLTVGFLLSGTFPLQPTIPGSFQATASGANATFLSQFATGSASTPCPVASTGSLGSANCMTAVNPNFVVPTFTTVANQIHYPTYMEWNLQIQHQFGTSDSIQIGYVGNRGYHEPNQNVGVNAMGGPFPAISPAPSFGAVNQIESNAMSNYNGGIFTWLHQGHGLTAQFNYEYSHALDQISNGGFLPFNAPSITYQIDPFSLSNQYGNADYDVRHYVSGNYLYAIPHYGGPAALTADWTVGGTIFWNTGNPFTPSQFISDFGVTNFGDGLNVTQIAPLPGVSVSHHCGRPSPTNPNFACLNVNDFAATASSANPNPGVGFGAPFGALGRNQFFGSYFLNTDLTILKGFHLPHLGEQTKFEGGATAYNLINHPNFGLPNSNADAAKFSQSTYLQGPPTSIYGSGLGGDPSIRIIELNGRIVF
jgi:hypothetical protein